ncbi:MAG: MATE family efflux transporter [Candidatus Hydrogenedentes bacterium]|nr:MATE family efflux transporter [Candidatus Hydrogenedentota bacterium]
MTTIPLEKEGRWDGFREVMTMSGPIVLGMLSFTVMEFADRIMVSWVNTEAIAAVGSATVWSYTLNCIFLGMIGCVSTFVGQSIGRNRPEDGAKYTWQGLYLGLGAGLIALLLWPLAGAAFNLMPHTDAVKALETEYFTIRLLGYIPMAWVTAIAAFFMAINRSPITMWAAIAANVVNLSLNYVLIFGHFGFPALGVGGAAWGTVIAQVAHTAILLAVFLGPRVHREFATRTATSLDWLRIREIVRVGFPSGLTFLMDVANWGIFISFIVGYFGPVQLAANNIAISFMGLSFMPAVAINQGIAPIVGQWIGRGDFDRAAARTRTAIKIAVSYMLVLGIVFAVFGEGLIRVLFQQPFEVSHLGHKLLILAAIFQGFDAVNIVIMGALRGAGDTKWMMWMMFLAAYPIFLPCAYVLAVVLDYQAFGAWVGAAIYIICLCGFFYGRFRSERWKEMNIFTDEVTEELQARLPDTVVPALEEQ